MLMKMERATSFIKRAAAMALLAGCGAMAPAAHAAGGTLFPGGDPQPTGQNSTTAAVKDDLFAGTEKFAKGATDVQEITMDPNTLGMVEGKDSSKAHGMKLSVVRTYTYDKPGMYNMADVDEFRRKLEGGEWHCSVHIRSLKTGDSTDICSKSRTDGMNEQAIITVSPKSLTFIHSIRAAGAGHAELIMR